MNELTVVPCALSSPFFVVTTVTGAERWLSVSRKLVEAAPRPEPFAVPVRVAAASLAHVRAPPAVAPAVPVTLPFPFACRRSLQASY